MPRTLRRTPTLRAAGRPAAALVLGALLLGTSACAEAKLEVGETTRVTEDAPSSAASPAAVPTGTTAPATVDPRLNAEPTAMGAEGAVELHLPFGWAGVGEALIAAAGEDAQVPGGATVTSVPAEGRSAEEWVAALVAGETDLFADTEGMEEREPVTTSSGLTLFHLAQSYSDNRAQIFGTVVDDTLHLVRFGLPGTDEAVEVAALSAATIAVG